MNKSTIMGNLTRDVEVKDVGEHKVAKFGVAVNEKYKDKEETMFIDCECWGNRAEVLEKYFKKGSRILLEGKLKFETWEKDGDKRSKHKITVSDFWFVDRKAVDENDTTNNAPPAKTQPKAKTTPQKNIQSTEAPPPF